jgi:hypothetical protein
MRRLVLMLTLLVLAPVQARAQFGPPQPRAACYGYSLGVGVHNVNSTWMPYDYDIARNRVYFEGSFGFNESLEGFARVGGSNWVINDVASYEPDEDHDISSDGYPAFVSGGIRAKLLECEGWSIGVSVEAAWYSGLEKDIRWDYDVYQTLLFDPPLEINAGLSLGCNLDPCVLYAGALLHFGYTRADVRTHECGPGWDVEEDIDALTIRDKAGFGAFVGWQIPLGEDGWQLQLEGAVLRGGFGAAIGIFKTL